METLIRRIKMRRLNTGDIFIFNFLCLFIISGILMVLRKNYYASVCAGMGFIFLLLGYVYQFDFMNRLSSKVYNWFINLTIPGLILVISVFYAFSSFIQFGQDEGLYVTLPKVYGGDEEHFLVMINSLIEDFDLDLTNNYEDARNGSYDAGEYWKGRILDHHSIFVHKDLRGPLTHFWDVVDVGPYFKQWEIKNPQVYSNRNEYYERPHHPSGIPFIFAMLLWPFAGVRYLESMALGLNTILVLISLIFLYKILCSLNIEKRITNISIFLIALATPIYHYSLILMKESFLAVILIFGCWLFFFKKNGILSGIFIIIGCFTRYAFPVVTIPLVLYGLIKKEWKLLVNFSLTMFLGALVYLLYNWHIYGGPFATGREGEFGDFLSLKKVVLIFLIIPLFVIILSFLYKFLKISIFVERNIKLLRKIFVVIFIFVLIGLCVWSSEIRKIFLDLDDGLFPVSPFLIFAVFKALDIKTYRDVRVVGVYLLILSYIAIYIVRGTGELSVYAGRKYVPVIPFLAIPFSYWYMDNKNKLFGWILIIFSGYSFIVNLLSSIARRYFWHLPLDQALPQLLQRIFGA